MTTDTTYEATHSAPALPAVVDRATWQAQLDALRVREKEHTRAGDALAAARRRLPMVEVDATIPLAGPDGPISLLDAFEGRRQLIAYYFMWHDGEPARDQCEGCTMHISQFRELSYLHERDVAFAVLCRGPYEESARYRDFMGWDLPWYSARDSLEALCSGPDTWLACYVRDGDRVFQTYSTSGRGVEVMAPSHALLDRTVYGRQEDWEASPEGWPERLSSDGSQWRTGGRPTAQLARLAAGHSDDLGHSGDLGPAPASAGEGGADGCCGLAH